jgi:hypothetical protein
MTQATLLASRHLLQKPTGRRINRAQVARHDYADVNCRVQSQMAKYTSTIDGPTERRTHV